MYDYIKGNIEYIGEDYIVIENNRIGYRINTSKNTIISIGSDHIDKKIYTHLNVREDDMSLFGFLTKDELSMFKILLNVSKIGPKVAIGVLSVLTPSEIKIAILSDDAETLAKAPGIGKKTASRIILELKDKIDDKITLGDSVFTKSDISSNDEVLVALLSLGYTKPEVNNVLNKINTDNLQTEEIIKLTLKELAK